MFTSIILYVWTLIKEYNLKKVFYQTLLLKFFFTLIKNSHYLFIRFFADDLTSIILGVIIFLLFTFYNLIYYASEKVQLKLYTEIKSANVDYILRKMENSTFLSLLKLRDKRIGPYISFINEICVTVIVILISLTYIGSNCLMLYVEYSTSTFNIVLITIINFIIFRFIVHKINTYTDTYKKYGKESKLSLQIFQNRASLYGDDVINHIDSKNIVEHYGDKARKYNKVLFTIKIIFGFEYFNINNIVVALILYYNYDQSNLAYFFECLHMIEILYSIYIVTERLTEAIITIYDKLLYFSFLEELEKRDKVHHINLPNDFKIEIEKLNYSIEKFHIRNDGTITLSANKHVLVTGNSGDGKSSFVKIVKGIINKDIELDIKLNDHKLNTMMQVTNDIYYSQQTVDNLFNDYLYNIITESLNFTNKETIERILKLVKLDKRLNYAENTYIQVNTLSGGEKTRLSMAKILYQIEFHNKKLVILDEVDTGLQTEILLDIFKSIVELFNKQNRTLIIITHNEFLKKIFPNRISVRNGLIKQEY